MSAPAPSLDHPVATRDPDYKAVLGALARRAGVKNADPILISGGKGSGKLSLARRYEALARHNGVLLPGALREVTCTGDPEEDACTIIGHKANKPGRPYPEARLGALPASHGGVLILHHVERLQGPAMVALVVYIDDKTKIAISTERPEPVDVRLILTCDTNFVEKSDSLLRRILDPYHFAIPSLVQRRADVEPNVDELLRQHSQRLGRRIDFTREARTEYIGFCTSKFAVWDDGFRDLTRSVQRLVDGVVASVIHIRAAEAEVDNLGSLWANEVPGSVPPEKDRRAEMMRKYLARYGLTFEQIKEHQRKSKKR